jgi:hypothetical protein
MQWPRLLQPGPVLDQLRTRDVAREVSAKRWRYIPEERTKGFSCGPVSNNDSIYRRTGDEDLGGDSPGRLDLAAE